VCCIAPSAEICGGDVNSGGGSGDGGGGGCVRRRRGGVISMVCRSVHAHSTQQTDTK